MEKFWAGVGTCGFSPGFLLYPAIMQGCRQTNSRNPNIIFILADDMGYGDPGCYNQEIIPVMSAKILL